MDIERLIDEYGAKKSTMDSLKKEVDNANKEIKQYFSNCADKSLCTDSYKATYSISQSHSLNEEALLEYFKNNNVNIDGLIKTREYVDMDVLENVLYNNLLAPDVVAGIKQFQTTTERVVLRVTPIKKGE